MGTYAAVLVTPEDALEPGWFARVVRWPPSRPQRPKASYDLKSTAEAILERFQEHGFVKATGASAAICRRPSFATSHLFTGPPADPVWGRPGIEWIHLKIEAARVQPQIGEIVYFETNRQAWDGLEIPEDLPPDELSIPSIDIFVFSQRVEIYDPVLERTPCTPWALIEFGFGDCRYSEDIHRIREKEHPVFAELESIYGCTPKHSVVLG